MGWSDDGTLLVDAAMSGIEAAFTGGDLGSKLLFLKTLNTLAASNWATVAVPAALGRITALPLSLSSTFSFKFCLVEFMCAIGSRLQPLSS